MASAEPWTSDFITIATTSPETMLGDTAVAVNPMDKRYKTRHFSMRGNESSHTLNEDAVRIGKRQDGKNFGIVCDGINKLDLSK